MSPADADKIGVGDNEWVEACNRNGVVAARAIVSHRIPEGTVFMHHAQERTMNTPHPVVVEVVVHAAGQGVPRLGVLDIDDEGRVAPPPRAPIPTTRG